AVIEGVKVGNYNGYSVQRVTRDGDISPGWPATGVSLYGVITTTPFRDQAFVTDTSGFVWHAWWTTDAQFVTEAEYVTPGGVGVGVAPGSQLVLVNDIGPARAAPASGGDMYFVVEGNNLLRITRSGVPAAGWENGVLLNNVEYEDAELR